MSSSVESETIRYAAAINRGLADQQDSAESQLQPYRIESRFDEGQIHGWLESMTLYS